MTASSPETPIHPTQVPPRGGRSVKPWIFLGCGCLTLLVLLIAAIVGFIFYKIKDSEAGRLTTRSVRESPVAREALGEIRDTGWPIGSISVEGGGSGKASFSMSVEGSKAEGKYYTTLIRENGRWQIVSARLELEDGRSIDMAGTSAPASAPDPLAPPPAMGGPAQGGRNLKSGRDSNTEWRRVQWPNQPIRFEVPSTWKEISLGKREVEFRPEDRSAYFIGKLTYFDQKISFGPLMDSLVAKSAAELKREEILGYALRDFGSAQGLLQIQRRGDGQTTAVWTGYFDTEEFGTVSVDFLLGAPTPADFDGHEATLGAILDSIRFR